MLAADALTKAPQGRIDEGSTVNFGTIQGGTATNIVAEEVAIRGEVRSHSQESLDNLTRRIEDVFSQTIREWHDPTGQAAGTPEFSFQAHADFPLMLLTKKAPVLTHIRKAADAIGMKLSCKIAGGGSDANIFNGYGLQTAIIATGMTNVHSTDEQVDLQDMVDLTRLLLALITISR